MTSVEFIYKEIPHSRGSIDKCINITPNEICTMLDKYAAYKAENLPISDAMRSLFSEMKLDEDQIINKTDHSKEFKEGFKEALRILAIVIKQETKIDVRDSA